MKALKTIFAIAFAMMASSVFAQNYLVVQKKDGRNVEIALSDIDQVYYANYEHKFVDLGLDSGTLWAECNLGATSPEQIGNYYRWGDTEAFGPASSKHWWIAEDTTDELKAKGVVNEEGYLNPEYDAATVNWGKDWAIPTPDQWNELWRQCEGEDIQIGDMYYRKYTGRNGNSIILPYGGYYMDKDNLLTFNDPVYHIINWLSKAKHEHNADNTRDFCNRACALTIRAVVKHLDH